MLSVSQGCSQTRVWSGWPSKAAEKVSIDELETAELFNGEDRCYFTANHF